MKDWQAEQSAVVEIALKRVKLVPGSEEWDRLLDLEDDILCDLLESQDKEDLEDYAPWSYNKFTGTFYFEGHTIVPGNEDVRSNIVTVLNHIERRIKGLTN